MGGHRHSLDPERLHHWLEHLAHVLPAQAPIRDFVHHNTLHGFQHLPFAEALTAARRLTGVATYLPEEVFRHDFAQGRISGDDLSAALEEFGIAGLDEAVVTGLSRRDILLASLLEAAEPPPPGRLAWERREWGGAEADLRAACEAATAHPAERALPGDWQAEARAAWEELAGRVGRDWTWRTLLEHLTGEDVLERVRTILLRHLGAHLDLGVAAWRNPEHGSGFYAAWLASAGGDFAWDLDELPNVRQEIADLPADPLAALAQELPRLVPEEELWEGYVEHLCLELPGWSGMFLRRDQQPVPDGTPVSMADYLAVRVILERLLCEDLARRLTGAAVDLAELGAYFQQHPAEFHVRRALGACALPEDILHRAQALAKRTLDRHGGAEAEWQEMAGEIARLGQEEGIRRQGEAWLLCQRARRLGLSAVAVGDLGREQVEALTACAEALDSQARGQVWLLAYERHYREQVFAALKANHGRGQPPAQPAAQVVFCMDDREEGTRRHLEEIAPAVETFGAAGFFGIPMYWQGLDDQTPDALCPVVVKPAHLVREEPMPEAGAVADLHSRRRNWRLAWRERFYQGTRRGPVAGPALTALAGVSALPALAAASLAPAWFGRLQEAWRRRLEPVVPTRVALTAADDAAPATPEAPRPGFTDAEQAARVGGFLRSIGLTDGFAPLVAFLGHGSASRNNPHLSAYDCGACSGRHGGPNARVFAAMANRPQTRALLVEAGIAIPAGTWFVAGEHNTCDDRIEWYDGDQIPAALQADFGRLAGQLEEAARAHAAERCRRFAAAPADLPPEAALRHVSGRRHDISEARPELGHATNAAAFIGRRAMSRGLFLDRRVFLISYDPSQDPDGAIAESILLAAGPVGAGISLEYYFSTVDNERLGCGSKVTHNVAGLFGVMEGASSDLRTGLPRQMIEIHEAMRLLVVVEQTPALLSAIVGRQPALRELVMNQWIILAAKSPDSGALHHFCPRRGWLPWDGAAVLPRVSRSADWYEGEREALPPALIGGAP